MKVTVVGVLNFSFDTGLSLCDADNVISCRSLSQVETSLRVHHGHVPDQRPGPGNCPARRSNVARSWPDTDRIDDVGRSGPGPADYAHSSGKHSLVADSLAFAVLKKGESL